MSPEFRQLRPEERDHMTGQGCGCDDWSNVRVAEGFDCEKVRSTYFSGQVRLGVFEKKVSFAGGVEKSAGISNARIHNCTIGDNVFINQVTNYIANYVIEDEAVIDNIDLLVVDGASCFGNGVEAAVVNEAGGREVPIYDHLSSHLAYLMVFYRHRSEVVKKLRGMISEYCDSVRSSVGLIGKGSRLINCRTIKNVKVGANCTIEGIDRLENGSINSSQEQSVYIGPGVIAEDFICCGGSKVTNGTIINKCFVGQSSELAKQYSAENSVFFANCGGFHGEACSIFAGPYTVTHHKSTLLISGLFSFLNAGSGSNQSNHMYKLGPVHQGVVERGSKTTSDSYILWPAKVGAFTVVMGRHYRNSDTSNLPFSYLIEHEDESILVPGVNLRSVGTIRDARKWPKRDKRSGDQNLDFINFKLLSPYTVQKSRGQWVDLAGLFAPETIVENLLDDIENNSISTLEGVQETFKSMHETYRIYEWAWAAGVIEEQFGKAVEDMTAEDIIEIVKKWKSAVTELDHLLYDDARKEFSATAQTGYGIDGQEEIKHADFEAVRGRFEENSFVAEIKAHMAAKANLGDELIGRMEKLIQGR